MRGLGRRLYTPPRRSSEHRLASQTYQDFRRMLDDKTIDAVVIVTPQHQHALNFVPAIQAGKDVYQEKTMAFNPDHARRMRRAVEGSNRVVQVGVRSEEHTSELQSRRDLVCRLLLEKKKKKKKKKKR